MEDTNKPNPQASSTLGDNPPTGSQPSAPKYEFNEGKHLIDGKEYVPLSDLVGAKKSLQDRLDQQQSVHDQAVDQLRQQYSEATQQLAAANAKAQQLEQARQSGVASDEEVTRLKQELDALKQSAEQASAKALEYRRKAIVAEHQVPVDHVEGKNAQELDAFEAALNAIKARGGPGPYNVSGGGPSQTPTEMTPRERAAKLWENTPPVGREHQAT